MFTVPLSFCAAAFLCALVRTQWRRRWRLRGLPVPPAASWVWGHEKDIFEAETGTKYTAWADELGPTYKIKSPWLHPDSLVTADPGAINHIFSKNTYNYHHSPVFRPLIERVIGRGLSWVEDQGEHRRMRSIVSPALTLASVRNMNGTIWNIANSFQTKIMTHITTKTNRGRPSVIIDLTYWMAVVTLEVIGRVGFNHDFGLGESKEAKLIIQGWHEQASAGLQPSGFVALVVLRTFPYITSLPVEAMQKQGETKKIVQKLARELVVSSSLEGNTDILSLLVTAQHRVEKHKQATLDEIIEHITTFTVTGHETAAGVLCFALHALAQYPTYQQRLRDEVLGFGREPSFDELWTGESFPYLEAVIKESLRLFPSAAHTEKVVQQDDVIPLRFPVKSADGKCLIREVSVSKGQVVHIPSRTVDRLKNVWGEDAGTFNPERFLNPAKGPSSKDTTNGWGGLFSFSEGPRMCVGFRLALFELKVITFMLISNFKFEDTGAVVIPRFASILQPIVQGEGPKGVYLPIRISPLA